MSRTVPFIITRGTSPTSRRLLRASLPSTNVFKLTPSGSTPTPLVAVGSEPCFANVASTTVAISYPALSGTKECFPSSQRTITAASTPLIYPTRPIPAGPIR